MADGGWRTYGGYRFRETGTGMFEFISHSNPGHRYTVNLEEAPYCDCWAARTSPPCPHLNCLKFYLKKLRNEKHL